MVSRPLRMTLAAASDSAKACARAPLTHDAPPTRPAYGLAQRRAPASLASRLHTAPRFAQPLACMLAAPHSVLWTRASAGRRKREVGSGPGTRRNPSSYGSILTNDSHLFTKPRIDSARCAPESDNMYHRPRSLITCIAPSPHVSTKNISTLFDTPSSLPATTPRASRA